MRRLPSLLLALAAIPGLWIPGASAPQQPATVPEASDALRVQIQQQTLELTQLREQVSAERAKLSGDVDRLQAEVSSLRAKAWEMRRLNEMKASGFNRLRGEVDALKGQVDQSLSSLVHFRRDLYEACGPALQQKYATWFSEADTLLATSSREDALRVLESLLDLARRIARDRLGIGCFPGQCLTDQGRLLDGAFVVVGPVTYFLSSDKGYAGIVRGREGGQFPVVVKPLHYTRIQRLLEGREERVWTDLSGGEYFRAAALREGWLDHLRAGGPVMIPILLLGLLGFLLAAYKMSVLSRLRLPTEAQLDEIVRHVNEGRGPEAFRLASGLGDPAGPVIAEGISLHAAPREHLEEVMHEKILFQVPALERFLPVMAMIASASPLLGLLGTVTGMIRTFKLLTVFAGARADMLSGGVSEALVTTEYGLKIAIPMLLIHAFLARRVKGAVHALEQSALTFINGVKIREPEA